MPISALTQALNRPPIERSASAPLPGVRARASSANAELQWAVEQGRTDALRLALLGGVDPFSLDLQRCQDPVTRRLLVSARLILRLFPAQFDHGRQAYVPMCDDDIEARLVERLCQFDLTAAEQLLKSLLGNHSQERMWSTAVRNRNTTLLKALIILGDARFTNWLGSEAFNSLTGRLVTRCQTAYDGQGDADLNEYLKTQPYFARTGDANPHVNLNMKARFHDASRLAPSLATCRHIALAWLEWVGGAGDGKVGAEPWNDVEQFSQSLSKNLEARYLRALRHAPEVHFLCAQAWGDFAVRQFDAMRERGLTTKLFLIGSSRHTMAARFRLARADNRADDQHIITFYDPNQTNTHMRARYRRLDVACTLRHQSIDRFLGNAKRPESYFDGQRDALLRVYRFMPGDAGHAIDAEPNDRPPQILGMRPSRISGELLQFLFRDGLGRDLQFIAERLSQPARRSTEPWRTAVTELTSLSEDQRAQRLRIKALPGWLIASRANTEQGVDALRALVRIIESSALPDETRCDLLAICDTEGMPCLAQAAKSGLARVVAAYVEAIMASRLSVQSKAQLLAGRDQHHRPALQWACFSDNADALRAYTQALLNADLPFAVKATLHAAVDARGKPLLANLAPMTDSAEKLTAYLRNIFQSTLTSEQKALVLNTGFNGRSLVEGLVKLTRWGQRDAIVDAIETIDDEIAASNLDEPDKMALTVIIDEVI